MKKLLRISILSVIIIIITILGIFVIPNLNIMSKPGGWFYTVSQNEFQNCFDTDSGANQFIRGSVRYQNWSFLDDCSVISATDTADNSETISILYEGYCASENQPIIMQFNCTKGCENGICLR